MIHKVKKIASRVRHKTHLVLNTRVLSLRVLTYENSVNVVVWRLVALDGHTWPNVGEEVECTTQGQV